MYILDDGLSREDCEEKRVFGQKRDGRIGTETVLTHFTWVRNITDLCYWKGKGRFTRNSTYEARSIPAPVHM
jgi:hypothetical protein